MLCFLHSKQLLYAAVGVENDLDRRNFVPKESHSSLAPRDQKAGIIAAKVSTRSHGVVEDSAEHGLLVTFGRIHQEEIDIT